MAKQSSQFRVVIAGGGIAGLALANALEQAGIDYVLLERRGEIAPQVGYLTQRIQILDQLGVYEEMQERLSRVNWMSNYYENGVPINEPTSANDLMKSRTGYELLWGDRRELLVILRDNLRDKGKLLVNKQVERVGHSTHGVTVHCKDGSTYEADVLVGADGVRSKVREEMWRLAEQKSPNSMRSDRNALSVEYNCLFGIAKLPDGWVEPGDVNFCLGNDRCASLISAKNDRVCFFASEKLDKTYSLADAPRYTDNAKEAQAFVARNGHMTWKNLTLADVWDKTFSFRLVPLEEGVFKTWTWGRIACVGDSVHKQTPNLGAGGNAAIESAATLANEIKSLADAAEIGRPTEEQVRRRLEAYQAAREIRATQIARASDVLIRIHTLKGLLERLFVRYGLALLADYLQEMAGDMVIGASKLDFLPLPLVSLRGTEPYNPNHGFGRKESKLKRALLALPFMVLAVVMLNALDLSEILPRFEEMSKGGVVQVDGASVPIIQTFYHVKAVDDLLGAINTFFFPTVYNQDPLSRTQTVSFLTDASVLITIWQLEAVRRANRLSPLMFPGFILLLGQVIGLGVLAPLYALLHYVLSPIEVFSARDRRLTNLRYTRAIPLAMLAFFVPLYGTYFHPSPTVRQVCLYIWQLYPCWIAAAQWLFSRLFADTVDSDKIGATQRDMPYINLAVGASMIPSASIWISTVLLGPHGFRELFIPTTLPKHAPGIAEPARQFLRIDELAIFGSALVWLGYLFGDMKRAGMVNVSWLRLVCYAVVGVLAMGPGTTLGIGWLWREDILATRWHKDARTEESLARLGERAAKEGGNRNGRK